MISQAVARGGAEYYSLSADKMLGGNRLLRVIVPTTGGLVVYLPRANVLRCGFAVVVIINDHATNSFDLLRHDDTVIATVAAQKIVRCSLLDNSTEVGVWDVSVKNLLGKGTA